MPSPFPVPLHWEGNVVFDAAGFPHAVYRVPLQSYAHLDSERKKLAALSLADLFYAAGELRGQLLSVCRHRDPEAYPEEFARLQRADRWPWLRAEHCRAVSERLARSRPWRRELYLVLRLRLPGGSGPLGAVRELASGLAGVFAPQGELPAEAVEAAFAAEREAAAQVASALRAEPAGDQDVAWLVRHGLFRGLGREPPDIGPGRSPAVVLARGKQVVLKPRRASALSLLDGCVVEERLKHIAVHHGSSLGEPGATCWQAFLPLADLPEDVECPGGEWLFWLEDLGFPVDACVHFFSEPAHLAQRKLYGKRKELESQIAEHIEGGDLPPIVLERASGRARVLEDKLRRGQPLLWLSAVLAVGAASPEELRERAHEVALLYRPRGFRVVEPPGDQLALFGSFFPGAPAPRAWAAPADPEYLAFSVVHGTREAGDPAGIYLGSGVTGLPVFVDPGRPMSELNRSGAVGIMGTLGGGKSVAAKYLAYASLLLGARAFVIDPKGEYGPLAEALGEGAAVLELSPESRARLNPLAVSPVAERSRAIAADFLSILLETSRSEARRLAVFDALEAAFSEGGRRSLGGVREALEALAGREGRDPEKAREAARAAELLEAYSRSPWGRIAFGEDPAPLSRAAALHVVQMAGLPLPRPGMWARGEGQMAESERVGVALMYLVVALGREALLGSPRQEVKLFVLDEGWVLTQVPEGRRLVEEIVRMGRSHNIAPILLSQNPKDLASEEVRNNTPSYMVFRLEDAREIRDAMQLLGLEPSEDVEARFRALQSGECFYRDAQGRVALVRVEPTPPKLLGLFGTTPGGGKGGGR